LLQIFYDARGNTLTNEKKINLTWKEKKKDKYVLKIKFCRFFYQSIMIFIEGPM